MMLSGHDLERAMTDTIWMYHNSMSDSTAYDIVNEWSKEENIKLGEDDYNSVYDTLNDYMTNHTAK